MTENLENIEGNGKIAVSESILKSGLDHLAECARKGEDVYDKVFNALGRAYDKRFDWHTDYQMKIMNAMKEGGLF
jgi:hypothetical protein